MMHPLMPLSWLGRRIHAKNLPLRACGGQALPIRDFATALGFGYKNIDKMIVIVYNCYMR